jgi:hypothetical protein
MVLWSAERAVVFRIHGEQGSHVRKDIGCTQVLSEVFQLLFVLKGEFWLRCLFQRFRESLRCICLSTLYSKTQRDFDRSTNKTTRGQLPSLLLMSK